MACYAVRDSHDTTLELKKVVFDTTATLDEHERAGDYLPLPRANGRRSVNHFQRVTVPTTAGPPSIVIPLWIQDSAGRFRTQSGSMRFLYGYVRAADGVRRFGWMAQDALEVSSNCP
jgi:hypothetical protein